MYNNRINMNSILSELQISRECALLGNYDTSLLYYEGVLNSIHQHTKTCIDPLTKDQWVHVRQQILQEFTIIKEISQELASFKERPLSNKFSDKYTEGVLASHSDKDSWSSSPLPKRANIAKRTSIRDSI
jgi:katanin p60 ATPase-containing subunit A1